MKENNPKILKLCNLILKIEEVDRGSILVNMQELCIKIQKHIKVLLLDDELLHSLECKRIAPNCSEVFEMSNERESEQ
ncbi:hypothetical protein KFK09_020403 [Dendrobium nobile]|uniref:Uncharacterized protein n=1 Tax=Dendrobium nobile TaxID=94219 RepID=A0A8T3AMH8_DENNO|nr:hypothetical protein KFK09_020403 [Dendrobium nobile]